MSVLMSNVAALRVGLPAAKPADEHETEYAPNGDPVLSPSQVAKYIMCPRKWAAQYLHGQREPVAQGTIDGKRMHSLLEDYYRKGTVPSNTTKEGTWALALIAKTGLPLPVPRAKVYTEGPIAERKFKFEHGGVWWRGSKDLTYLRDGRYIIRDHKTTSELNPLWVKSEEQLKTDPQSVIYSFEAFLTDEPDEVECEWGYVTRKDHPQTDLHRVRMTWDLTQYGIERLTRVGLEMLKHYRERPGLNDLPPDGTHTGGCEAFRGCKVVGCNVSALDRITGQQLFQARKQGGHDMGFLDTIRARNAQQAALTPGAVAAAATPPSTPPPAPAAEAPPQAPAPANDIRSRLAAVSNGAAVAPTPYTPSPSPQTQAVAAPTPSIATTGEAPRRGRGRARAAATTPAPTPQQIVETVGQAVGAEAVASAPPPAAPIGDRTRAEAVAMSRDVGAVLADGYVLYVNCAPVGEPVILLSEYLGEVHKALKESKGWTHYALYSFEGKAAFQDCLTQLIEHSPPVGNLVVRSASDEGRDAMSVLERYAIRRVQGF